MPKQRDIIALSGPATIAAADSEKKGPRRFEATVYTGGPLEVAGYDMPVVVDLATLKTGNSLVANLDHDRTKRVGNVTEVANDGKTLKMSGLASAATAARDEVVASADDGFTWQTSIEARPGKVEAIRQGRTVTVNGQQHTGPVYVARDAVTRGFGFVSHGADDNTSATIAASAASTKGNDMDKKLKAWIEAMLPGTDISALSEESVEALTAQYNGQNAKPKAKAKVSDVIAAAKNRRHHRPGDCRQPRPQQRLHCYARSPGRQGD
jgi:hypothetical protein